MVGFTEKRKCT